MQINFDEARMAACIERSVRLCSEQTHPVLDALCKKMFEGMNLKLNMWKEFRYRPLIHLDGIYVMKFTAKSLMEFELDFNDDPFFREDGYVIANIRNSARPAILVPLCGRLPDSEYRAAGDVLFEEMRQHLCGQGIAMKDFNSYERSALELPLPFDGAEWRSILSEWDATNPNPNPKYREPVSRPRKRAESIKYIYGMHFENCHFEGDTYNQTIMTAPEATPEAQKEEAAPVETAETETVVEATEAHENGEQPIEDRIRQAIARMRAERLFKNKYDYAWVMVAMREMTELPERLRFTIPCEFYAYMKEKIGLEDLPSLSSIQKAYTKGIDEKSLKYAETQRREGVKKRFISAFRKGI